MAEIRLTPAGHLRWESSDGDAASPVFSPLARAFERDWREGLFTLAAEKAGDASAPTLRYWRQFSERHLSQVCHVPESAAECPLEGPDDTQLAAWVLTAPPMQGGEYLTADTLSDISGALLEWMRGAISEAGGPGAFLQARAPKWRQVGRVCFHLAENKGDGARPFAFMATYATGMGEAGQVKYLPLRRALEQYAGSKNKNALIKLLSPVHEAAKRCGWVKGLVDSGDLYQPMAWPVQRAHQFLKNIPELEESGLSVRVPNWWKKRPRPRVSVTIGEKAGSLFGAKSMLDFNVAAALGEETLTPEEVNALLGGNDGLVLFKGQWVEVDRERLREALEHWQQVRARARDGEISFIEGMRLLAGAPDDLRQEEQAAADREWVHVNAGAELGAILGKLREPGNLDLDGGLDGIRATLRPYQRAGVSWLRFLAQLGLGACLADDMGLGKTLQVLALLAGLRGGNGTEKRRPALLVVPASLLGNWRGEAARFAPGLSLCFLHPAECDAGTLKAAAASPETFLSGVDLAVTTYSMVVRQEWLTAVHWGMVILDEAQAIKNPGTHQSRAVKKLAADARIALTGTPVENRLGDLWSLFDFLNPGLLGSAKVFTDFVKRLQGRSEDQYAPLRRLTGPYILRRLKTDRSIIADLPEKTETLRYCSLTRSQVRLYEGVVRGLAKNLEEATEGIARRGLVLQSLMRLKQVCNHPSQLSGDGEYSPLESGKFARMSELCGELAERQEKALVFTQFREIIEPLSAHLASVFGRPGLALHGGTAVKQRQRLVEQFQEEDGPPFFILSLKAGGTGLNLTAASHVIHFDRWWNPAVENQATDRAFRIGQKRNVLVHKLVTSGTIEEQIDAMITQKRELADRLLSGNAEVNLTELSNEDLLQLVRLDVTRATA